MKPHHSSAALNAEVPLQSKQQKYAFNWGRNYKVKGTDFTPMVQEIEMGVWDQFSGLSTDQLALSVSDVLGTLTLKLPGAITLCSF